MRGGDIPQKPKSIGLCDGLQGLGFKVQGLGFRFNVVRLKAWGLHGIQRGGRSLMSRRSIFTGWEERIVLGRGKRMALFMLIRFVAFKSAMLKRLERDCIITLKKMDRRQRHVLSGPTELEFHLGVSQR